MRKKSGNVKRIHRKTPGNRTTLIYKRKRHGKAVCAVCSAKLPGVPTGPKSLMRNLPKSKKRVNRKYGGYLCSRCMRVQVTKEVRGILS